MLKPGQFLDVVRAAAITWVLHSFNGYRSDVDPAMIDGLAADLGIDFAGEWRLTEDFLQLQPASSSRGWRRNGRWSSAAGSCPKSSRTRELAR